MCLLWFGIMASMQSRATPKSFIPVKTKSTRPILLNSQHVTKKSSAPIEIVWMTEFSLVDVHCCSSRYEYERPSRALKTTYSTGGEFIEAWRAAILSSSFLGGFIFLLLGCLPVVNGIAIIALIFEVLLVCSLVLLFVLWKISMMNIFCHDLSRVSHVICVSLSTDGYAKEARPQNNAKQTLYRRTLRWVIEDRTGTKHERHNKAQHNEKLNRQHGHDPWTLDTEDTQLKTPFPHPRQEIESLYCVFLV